MAAAFEAIWETLTASGEPFSWSVRDVRGVPTRCYDTSPENLRDVWALTAVHGDAEYLVFEDERHTYADVHAAVRRLSAHLVDTYGVGRGDRVAIAMRNYPEWVISYWAIISTGAAVVGMNALWTGAEMEYGLDDSAPRVVVCDGERLDRLLPHLDSLRQTRPLSVVVTRGDVPAAMEDTVTLDDIVCDDGDVPDLPDVSIAPEDDCCVFYTSGTTGFPKGAVMTHRAVLTNMVNLGFWSALVAATSDDTPSTGHVEPAQPAVLIAVPLFHVTGCNCSLHPYSALGGRIVLMYRWDPRTALEIIETERVVGFSGVPVMSREMVEHTDFARYDTSSLNALGGGGAPMQPDLVETIDAELERARPATGYGLTETSGVISLNSADFYVQNPSSVGPPVPVMETRIIDADGNELAAGAVGELCVRGANVIRGYLNKPEATAEAIEDGWFHTGDLAFVDERNFITIVDRVKDMVLRGGENIYCAEVEAAIYDHPGIRECAVFAVPHDRLGEVPGVAVVLKDGVSMTSAEVRAHAGARIATYKVPDRVWILDEELPRNANGKFLKRSLQTMLVDGDVTPAS